MKDREAAQGERLQGGRHNTIFQVLSDRVNTMELHLVPDTNLFFEFKALDQLPWEELGRDPIVLLLTKPVLDEIDRHKKGTGRTRDRALDIYGRFRAMLEAGFSDSEIRSSAPKVILRRATNVLPDPALRDHLDYEKADEKLIGIVSALKKQTAGHEVKLFTDDGGPAGMAQDLGVPFKMIDQAWRRPPAETTEAKQIRDLKKIVEIYQSQEPKIAIRCQTADRDGVVTTVGKAATPLSEAEVDELVEALRLKHPLREDFTPPETKTTNDTWGETRTVEYSTPPEQEIANYRENLYPKWLDDCRGVLRSVHVGRDEAAPPVVLRWSMTNDGSRPAERVRVEFETSGPLALHRPRPARDDDKNGNHTRGPASPEPARHLPPAPKPPAFGQKVTCVSPPAKPASARGFDISTLRGADPLGGYGAARSAVERLAMGGAFSNSASDAMRRMQDSIAGITRFDDAMRAAMHPIATPRFEPIPVMSPHLFRAPQPPDPEEFYYASWPVDSPVQKGALTCQLWRHQTGDETFEFNVLFGRTGDARGVVECTVHADKITEPPQAKVIVERRIEAVSMFDIAKAMVDACG